MKKTNRIKIIIGRFGIEPETLEITEDSTVEDALKEAGISLSSGEKVWVGGEKAVFSDVVENGDIINIVGSKEGGSK